MLASQELASKVAGLTVRNENQPRSVDRDHLGEVFKARIDSGGMVLVDSDIYPVDPLNTPFADIVLPAACWGELEDVTTDKKWLYAFGTHTGKANMLKAPWDNDSWSDFYEAIKPRTGKGEIWITNGRVNETWQSGFDDLRKPELAKRWPWPHIVIHPHDAAPHGIESGDLVEGFNDTGYVQTGEPIGVLETDLSFTQLLKYGHITTTTGQFVAVAIVSDEIRPGVAKAAFNYPGSMANSVCHAVPDPVSGNYRYKLGRGVLRRIGESAYKHNFLEMSPKPRPIA
jgi:arsenite oxidase large subunit